MIIAIVMAVVRAREQTGRAYHSICLSLEVCFSTVMRWKHRYEQGREVIRPPGPRKTEPLDYRQLHRDLRVLAHGRKRSSGAADVYRTYQNALSRREYGLYAAMARAAADKARRARQYALTWNVVSVCWAMDATKYVVEHGGTRQHIQQLEDLASRYRFGPVCDLSEPCGEKISGHLAAQFGRYGAPLFLKRDNGGNQNHGAVNEVLGQALVLPLNSPCWYAPYNGAVEKAQGEFKTAITKRLMYRGDRAAGDHFEAYAETAVHALNHLPRRALKRKTSCQVFFSGISHKKFTKNERRDIYEWLMTESGRILNHMDRHMNDPAGTAWRVACFSWLRKQNLITVRKNGKVLPYSELISSH